MEPKRDDVKVRLDEGLQQRVAAYASREGLTQGEAISARFDLKADRKNGSLLVLSSHSQPEVNERTAVAAAQSLLEMARWLGRSAS